MHIVPVIDLQGGHVVRAVRGERHAYRPIVSALCASSDPLVVAPIVLAHCRARTLYVADLDAIAGRPAHVELIACMLAALPGVALWLDAGCGDRAAARRLIDALGADAVTAVYGSESIVSRAALAECRDGILSLDERGGRRLDPAGCWDAPELWPKTVIAMTLDRVGAATGPDLETLARLRKRAPHVQWVGAGGIRDASDLDAARDAGAFAWLVASALHDLRLPASVFVR